MVPARHNRRIGEEDYERHTITQNPGPTYITPEDTNGTDHPDEEKWCRERKADGGFVGSIARLHRLNKVICFGYRRFLPCLADPAAMR